MVLKFQDIQQSGDSWMNHSFETDKIISVFNELISIHHTSLKSPVLVIDIKTVFTMNGSTEYVTYDVYGDGRLVEYEIALKYLSDLLETERLLSDEKEIIGGEI